MGGQIPDPPHHFKVTSAKVVIICPEIWGASHKTVGQKPRQTTKKSLSRPNDLPVKIGNP